MPLLRVQHVTVRLDGQIDDLFRDVSLEINPHDRIGLIGPNGCGKTTLLRVLTDELRPVSGEVVRPKSGTTLGYLRQQSTDIRDWPVLHAVLAAFPHLVALKETLVRLEAQMSTVSGDTLEPVVTDYGNTLDAFHKVGGYEAEREATATLLGLGFSVDELSLSVRQLSSGQRTRTELARLLIQPSDLLLLDEPTNHLDIDAREAVEGALVDYPGTILFVSHDRRLIERLADALIVVADGQARYYPGTYEEYREARSRETTGAQNSGE